MPQSRHQLDYAPARRRQFNWRRVRKIILIVTIIATPIATIRATFRFISVCPLCAREMTSIQWQFPFTEVSYWKAEKIRDTPLSRLLAKLQQSSPHTHTWHFAFGTGNGTMCAIGDGRFLSGVYADPAVLTFVENVIRFDNATHRDDMMARLQDPARCRQVSTMASLAGFPKKPFSSLNEFTVWCKANRELWDQVWDF